MVEERRQFPKRWPHLTTLYNASPFMSTTRSYKEVDEWNSLRPLPTPIGGYPPSYEDTYSRDVFASYNPQRQISGDKFGRGYANSNYDAFSMSTYHTAPHFRKQKVSKSTHFLSCAIGISLMLALIGAIAAVVIVLSNGSNCDAYEDSVWVEQSSYDHSKLTTDSDINYNFTRDFCYELETAFRTYFTEDHMCGCRTVEISVDGPDAFVSFNIDYRRINEQDKNETYVGRRLAVILNKIINESRTPSFVLSYNWPHEAVTKVPMFSIGNETLMGNGTDYDDIINGTLDTNETASTASENQTNSVPNVSNSSTQAPIEGGTQSAVNLSPTATESSLTLKPSTQSSTTLAPTVQPTTVAEQTTRAPVTETSTSSTRPTTAFTVSAPAKTDSPAPTTTTQGRTTTMTEKPVQVPQPSENKTVSQATGLAVPTTPDIGLTPEPQSSTPQTASPPVTTTLPVLPTVNDIATTIDAATNGTTPTDTESGNVPVPLENPQTTASNYANKETTLSNRNPPQGSAEGSQVPPTT